MPSPTGRTMAQHAVLDCRQEPSSPWNLTGRFCSPWTHQEAFRRFTGDQGSVLGCGNKEPAIVMMKPGRPKKEPHEKRTARLPAVRLTTAERIDLELKAEAAGFELSEWVRRQLTAVKVTRSKMAASDAGLITELNRIGNNVNQIARQLNRGREHDPEHLGHVMFQLNSVLEGLVRRYGP